MRRRQAGCSESAFAALSPHADCFANNHKIFEPATKTDTRTVLPVSGCSLACCRVLFWLVNRSAASTAPVSSAFV